MSLLSLIAQSVPALAQTSGTTAVIPKRVITTEVVSEETSFTTSTAKASNTQAQEGIPANTSLQIQAAGANTIQKQIALNATEAQVTSVSQLSDVQPQDWAFGVLQSLVERYGVIAGYPDSNYRGNRAMTRYEFAAGLNAVLERVNELISKGLADKVSRDDLVTLQRLQEEFAAELVILRGRVDTLEANTAELEANQFSTTTKLGGQVIFAVNGGGFSSDRIVDPTGAETANDDPNVTALYRLGLDFNTSFFGTDLLKLRLDSVPARGNDNAAGFLEPNFGSVLEFTVRGTPDTQFGVSRLYYAFTPFKDVSLTLGPAIVTTDYIDINSYANGNGIDFSTLALVNNYLLFPVNGPSAGAVINWNPEQGPFKVRALYAAADAANPSSNNQRVVGSIFPFARLLYPDSGGERGLFGSLYRVHPSLASLRLRTAH